MNVYFKNPGIGSLEMGRIGFTIEYEVLSKF